MIHHSQPVWSLCLVSLLIATACHRRLPPAPCDPSAQVDIAIGQGNEPPISWTPACSIGDIIVQELPNGPYWSRNEPDNSLPPPITFGTMGRYGAKSLQRLTPQHMYHIRLGVISGGDAIFSVGSRTFVR